MHVRSSCPVATAMKYYTIDPDVPGRLAVDTITAFRSGTPELVNYVFECWPDSDMVQADPVFLVSDRLASALSAAGLTGFTLKLCFSSKGEQFHIASPGCGPLPTYRWLFVNGTVGVDDFGISEDLALTISENALGVMRGFNLQGLDMSPAQRNLSRWRVS